MQRTQKSRLHRAIAWGASILLLAAMVPPILAQNGAIQYFYDDLGQLVRAVDQNGNVATYSYDSRGNLLSITRSTLPANNGLSLLNFTPQSGPVGQSVTIQGQGFSTTLSANTVQFNGVAAAVTAATASTLTVTVPSTATTGPISVMVGTQTATSSANFNVTNQIVSFAVSPQNVSVHFGAEQQQQFTATGYYTGGSSQNLTAVATWGSSSPSVATISNSPGSQGLATIVGSGTTTVTASYGASLGSSTLVVGSPVSLSVTPPSATIFAQLNQQFSATEAFSDGSTQNVTSQVTWSSTNTNVVTVNSTTSPGLATGITAGIATVCAVVSGGPSGCSSVTVKAALVSLSIAPANESIPKGVSQQFTATGLFTDGSTQNLTGSVTWSSSNPSVATIVSNGLVTDVAQGTTTISATLGSISGSTSLTLTAPVAASISVSPSPAAISAGGTLQLTANLVFTDGSTQSATQTATWSTSAADVAVVSNAAGSQGLVTRVGPGTAIITAASGSFSGIALVANSSATSYPRFLYVSNGGGSIFSYSVNAQTGQLRANGSVQVSNQSGNLTLDPSQSYLYFSVPSAAGNLFAFSVNPATGALTQVSGSPYTAGTSRGPVVAEPSDRFVYVGDPSTDSIFGFSIGAGGALTALPGSPYAAGGAPTALLAHPSGKFLFELNQAQSVGADPPGSVSVFAINSNNGALTPISGSPFEVGDSPVALAQDPAGKYLYVSNLGQNSSSSRIRWPRSSDYLEAVVGRTFAYPERNDLASVMGNAGSKRADRSASNLLLASLDRNSFSPFPVTATDGEALALARPPFRRLFFQGGGSNSPSISAFAVDPNAGTLTAVSGSPFIVSSGLSSISVDTTGQYLYGETFNSVFGFSISGGALTPLSNSPFSLSLGPIVFDPSGLFAYAQGGNGVQEMGTNSNTGTLTALPGGGPIGGASIAISGGTAPIIYVPQFAYVVSSGAANGANNISGYSINAATGVLARLEGAPFAEGFFPVFATADMFGQSLYVANNCSDPLCTASNGSVSGYAITPGSGALTAAAGSPFPAGVAPVSVALQPPGINAQSSTEYAYVASQNAQFFEYSVNPATGVLTAFSGSPAYTSTNGVIATAVDPTGSFLYVITSCSGCANDVLYGYDLFLYQGQLIFQPPVITATLGTAPRAIGVDPGGRFVLVADGASNTVSVLSTQSYSQVAGSPFATDGNPSAVALDPAGQFVYIANQATNDVSAYTMNPSTGLLTPVSGSPYTVGAGPVSLSVDFSGQFLYVTNNGDGTVSAFSITAGSGSLTPVPGSPFPAGTAPISVVTTGMIQ